MKICGIYGIRNSINGKWLIGSSKQIHQRWKQHIYNADHKKHGNIHFQRAWNQYGKNSFEFHVLEECLENMLVIREDAWMEYYHSLKQEYGYNLKNASQTRVSEETRKKMSAWQKGSANNRFGKPCPENTRLAVSKTHKGVAKTEISKLKNSMSHLGKPRPRHVIVKMHEALKAAWVSRPELRQQLIERNKARAKSTIKAVTLP